MYGFCEVKHFAVLKIGGATFGGIHTWYSFIDTSRAFGEDIIEKQNKEGKIHRHIS